MNLVINAQLHRTQQSASLILISRSRARPGQGRVARGPRGRESRGRRARVSGRTGRRGSARPPPARPPPPPAEQRAPGGSGVKSTSSRSFPHAAPRERSLHTRARTRTARSLPREKRESGPGAGGHSARTRGGGSPAAAAAGGARPARCVRRSALVTQPRASRAPTPRPGREAARSASHRGLPAEAPRKAAARTRLRGGAESHATHGRGGEREGPSSPQEFSSKLPLALRHLCVCVRGERVRERGERGRGAGETGQREVLTQTLREG